MCSILAYCSGQADPQVMAEMLAKTISRGPDDHHGAYAGRHAALCSQ